jgi:pseudouridine 5'-phosphatase
VADYSPRDIHAAEKAAAEHLLSFFPDIPMTVDTYLAKRNSLQDALWPTVPLMPGVRKLIFHLKQHGIPIAIATSTRRRNLALKTSHLGDVFECFDGKIVCGDDAEYNMRGKPYPDIFLIAAKELLGQPVGSIHAQDSELTRENKDTRQRGLIFEDSLPGVQAGKRAGMNGWSISPSSLFAAVHQ